MQLIAVNNESAYAKPKLTASATDDVSHALKHEGSLHVAIEIMTMASEFQLQIALCGINTTIENNPPSRRPKRKRLHRLDKPFTSFFG
jgi:hypothetical protein